MSERGTIQTVNWTQGSGIATVEILTDYGDIVTIPVEASPFFRALTASGAKNGSRISYEVTDYGTMSHFQVED